MKGQDQNSNRFKKRQSRKFNGSRPNRRAEERLAIANGAFEAGKAISKSTPQAYNKPGAMKRW